MLQPIRLHVDAKRYLCARGDGTVTGAEYWAALSIDSKRSLELQGGIFSEVAGRRVQGRAVLAKTACACACGTTARSWQDAQTPPLSHYLALAARVAAR